MLVPRRAFQVRCPPGTVHPVQVPRIPPVLSTASLILRPVTDGDGPVVEPPYQ